MPRGGGELRSRQLALLAELAHARATSPEVEDWLLVCEADAQLLLDGDRAAIVRGLRRDRDRATRLPTRLVAELAQHESKAQQEWVEARAASDYARFLLVLKRMVELQQQKAACLARPGQSKWDALADLYEPGANEADLAALFAPLRERLVALRHELDHRGRRPKDDFARVPFDAAAQERCVRAVLGAMGFDFERGRLDRSAHPFCTGSGGDVRLTTRFAKDNFLDALGSTMHEGGHGLYEQGLDEAQAGTPLGEAVSLGIHESQSRLWENHVGRSLPFFEWAQPVFREHLGSSMDAFSPRALFESANLVTPSLIRVEADELTYDLHVMIRFELERRLLDGSLGCEDLPAAWNARYRDDLGVAVPDDRRGCLQDVHWSCGLFGYFPTYTLGNLYAAQFAEAARRALPDFDGMLARGEFAPLREWLRENVHRHGRRYEPRELCRRATGRDLSTEPFLHHLETRLRSVYGIEAR